MKNDKNKRKKEKKKLAGGWRMRSYIREGFKPHGKRLPARPETLKT
jgi:hypothetical protein